MNSKQQRTASLELACEETLKIREAEGHIRYLSKSREVKKINEIAKKHGTTFQFINQILKGN